MPIPPKKVNKVVVKFYSEAEKERYKEMMSNSMEAFKVWNNLWLGVACFII